ncbi:MAG: polysaccharide deacetylase family protein, partial [bacterium]
WKHMSWEQIREMADAGFEFGSHTENHLDLTSLAADVALRELVSSKAAIEKNLDAPCLYLSYPFGRTNAAVRSLAQEAGYKAAFNITPRGGDEAMDVGRRGMYVIDFLFDLKAKLGLLGSLMGKAEALKGRAINLFSAGTTMMMRHPDYNAKRAA